MSLHGTSAGRRNWLWRVALAAPMAACWTAAIQAREPEKTAPQPIAAASASSERAAVESSLSAMAQAVLAGDRAAYLKHVVPASGANADPIFHKEQENWAKDLKDHVPEMFELSIQDTDEQPAKFWPTRAEFSLKTRWRMKAEDKRAGGSRVRSVATPVVFVRSDDAEGGWLFAGENWIVIEGEPEAGIRVKCAPGYEKAARDAAAVFGDVRAHVEEGFEEKVARVQEVKIYGSMRHLQESIYLSYVDALGGWNEPGESIKILGETAGSKGTLKQVLAHEFGHVATFEYGPHANDMPWWILEGVAELSSETFAGRQWESTQRMVRGWAASGQLEDWKDLTDFRSVPPAKQIFVYRQGEHMIGYISERFGRAGRNNWLRAMAGGKSLEEATQEALHLSFDQLDKDWRKSLGDEDGDGEDRKDRRKPAP